MPEDVWSGEANMINCCNQRRSFFEKYGSIDGSLLIAYWMMADYLPMERYHRKLTPMEAGYEKGITILMELKRRGMLSETLSKFSASTSSHLNDHCTHKGHCTVSNPGLDDLLDLPQLSKLTLTDGVLQDETGSLVMLNKNGSALTSLKRFKYIACFDGEVDSVLENVDNPSLLLFRDCRDPRSKIDYSFEKFANLTALEISASSYPAVNIPELTQLQHLNLSGSFNEELPEDFFSKLKQLRWLILRGCYNVRTLPSLNSLINLEVLDLSSSKGLQRLAFDTISSPKLRILECSDTAMTSIPQLESTQLTHVVMNYSKVRAFTPFEPPRSIQLLDLSHSELEHVNLSRLDVLQVLDLSFSEISSIDSVEDKVHLRKLILTRCRGLKKLPALDNLKNLEVLDLSETGISSLPSFANQSRLQKLSLRNLRLGSLENLSSLSGLVDLDLFKVRLSSSGGFNVDFLGSLLNLQTLNLSGTCVVDLPVLINHKWLKELYLADCPQLKTLPDVNTLRNLDKLVLYNVILYAQSESHERIRHSKFLDKIKRDLESEIGAATPANDNTHTRQLEKVMMDLQYVIEHGLYISPNLNKACELTKRVEEVYVCLLQSQKLEMLVQTVAKLKLLIPRTETDDDDDDDSQSSVHVEKKEPKFKKVNAVDVIIKKLTIPETTQVTQVQMEILSSYESLTSGEKHCLLCFSIFPLHVYEGNDKELLLGRNLEIKKKTLIYWWVGEGFINIHSEQVTSVDKAETKKAIEDTGEDILKVLTCKGFIHPVIRKGRETRRCSMNIFVHSFVTRQAKLENFFNFSNKNGKLTPMLKGSHRACLLRSKNCIPSSCQFWAVNAKSPDKLKRFKMVKTLFNVDESVIHIQPEWFSSMKDLSVLHLGNWHSEDPEHIEVRDKTFMEGLKRMKQLKFFSLQGVSTIAKLPDSVCKLANLTILDLKECHELEDLPANIGSLRNLTHLDISNCHLLYKLPKGVMLLSKLEVLKGFVIYEQSGDLQNIKENIVGESDKRHRKRDLSRRKKNEACTFIDLLKLENLRKLSIVVNNENFPDINELEVLKRMKNLHKLKISWGKNLMDYKRSYGGGQQGDDNRPAQEDQGKNKHVEKKPSREYLGQIEKLELWGFPKKTAPEWLVPDEFENLKKLYIRGGMLEKLPEISSLKEWNVTTLRLRYLTDLVITWDALRAIFPNMTYLDKCECKKLYFFPCDDEGVWIMD